MSSLSVKQTAAILGVSDRRVRAMIADELLAAERVGGRWILTDAEVARFRDVRRKPGRPYSSAHAWGLLSIAGHRNPAWLSRREQQRLTAVLADTSIEDLAPSLRRRAEPHAWYVHPGLLTDLAEDGRVVIGGHGATRKLRHTGPGLLYLSVDDLDALGEEYRPTIDAVNPNVTMLAIQQSSILLVIVSRPDRQSHGWDVIARADRELGESFTETRLRPLDDGDSRELVANLLEIEALSDDLRRQILGRAEGNPFFIEEVVRMLVDRDLIEEMDGRWVAKGEITSLDVPDTLHGLLASRIDGLPSDVRRTAMLAAVIGRRFEKPLLTSVLQPGSEDEEASVSSDLSVLEAQGLTKLVATRPELAFMFRHALIHDVTYAAILKKDRRRLHAEVGDAIARMYPDRLEEQAATLARHYEEAGDQDQTLRYVLLAGEVALSRHAMRESHDFYTRASALLDANPEAPVETKIEVALARAAAGINFTPGDQTIELLEGVRGDAEALGDTEVIARVYALLLRIRTMMEESYADRHYRDLMDRAFELAPTVQTPELRAYLEGMMGQVLRSMDDYAASVDLIGGSVAPLEEAGRVGEAGLNAAFTADAEASQGRFDEADRWIERATALGEESGNPSVIADVNLFKGRIAAAQGDLEAALEHTRLGIEMAAGASNIQCELVGNFMVADQQLRLGEPEAAISHLERTFELGEFCNAVAIVKLGEAWLTSAKANLGDLDPEGFSGPLAMAQAGRSRSGEAAVRLQRAITISASPTPDWPAAFDDYERSIALFESIGARPDQARAIHAYANALDAAGRDEESRNQLDAAMAMFDEMGIRPDMVPV